MAPTTPKANSKLPKPPSAGGPIPLSGIPAPGSVLQRRTFMSVPGASSVSKTLKDMTPEQQALLAEAISMHSPGLIDPARRTTTTTTNSTNSTNSMTTGTTTSSLAFGNAYASNNSSNTSLGGMSASSPATALGFSALQHSQHPSSPSPSSSDRASPTGLASPLSYRPASTPSSTSQLGRRPSSSHLRMHPETPSPTSHPHANNNTISSQQPTRPASYSGMSPLSTSNPNLPMTSSSPSPTTSTAGLTRPVAGSPSGSRPALTGSRLSAGSAGTGAGLGGIAPGGSRSGLLKQPLFQRPPGTTTGLVAPMAGAAAAKHLQSAIPGAVAAAVTPPSLDNYEIGDRVIVESMALSGYLRFVGPTEFKTGTWAGIELDTPTGKNDGSVGGVTYFSCRPKCGIFVLAAKIVKSELLFPSSLEPAVQTQRPPSVQEDNHGPLPQVSHAAQVASRITAGSRASKYVGMTATQLKQRHGSAPPASITTTNNGTITTTSRLSMQNLNGAPGTSVRASSPTIRALSGMTGSPTAPRTLTSGSTNGRANSPSPVPKPLLRASSPTTRTGVSARQSLPATKPALGSLATKPGAHSRSTSSTSSVTSQSSVSATARARTSPTPRTLTTPRRLSSRSDTPDASTILSPSESRSNLLDQATAIQTAGSPKHEEATQQLQQLRLDLGAVMAENSLLKSEVQESKGREGADERILAELEELQTMKIVWEKEKAAKDQEIKVVTEKMTQAWLEAARSQKEKVTLTREKTELAEKLQELKESNGMADADAESMALVQEQKILIESLEERLQQAEEASQAQDQKVQDLESKALEQEERLAKISEESQSNSDAKQLELETERDILLDKLISLEEKAKTDLADKDLLLQAALDEAAVTKDQLQEAQDKLKVGAEESLSKLEQTELVLQQAQDQLAKTEKTARGQEEKMKEYDSLIAKRDQEIANFKLELQDLAGMVQSEEVDRMRKVWENEKKRLEEAVTDNIIIMTTLRSEIQTLEASEDEYTEKIKSLDATIATLTESKAAAEEETSQLQLSLDDSLAKLSQAEEFMTNRLAETKDRMDELEEIAQTVDEWRERCEALQLETIQKTAMLEESGFNLEELQSLLNFANQANDVLKKDLERKNALLVPLETLEQSRTEVSSLEEEREDLLAKIAELEAALTLSASVPTAASTGDNAVVLNRAELEEEISGLKAMVHELTAENAAVAGENKKLMQEHDILMEAHKHVETECLKLMDEVERLHSESLAVSNGDGTGSTGEKDELDLLHHGEDPKAVVIGQDELKAALNNLTALTKDTSIVTASEKQAGGLGGTTQSASVIRLEGLLKEKQALLDRLTQAHALEMRDLRQRYVELDRSKSWELAQLNKELTELESLIESKIFHEADLEEEVQQKQKQIDRLQREVSDLRSQLTKLGATPSSSFADLPPTPTTSSMSKYGGTNGHASTNGGSDRTRTTTNSTADQALFCEICEVEGHDLISCVAVFGGANKAGASAASAAAANRSEIIEETESAFSKDLEDERAYCENCEEFGQHYTDECPNESLTY
ncbi:hypothetical protein EMPS_05423 [Entomortierella parvispora]|uniref:CAP-Gly domain-containing protein n=1 Tax=Entomortierella parvispora TaxID=205924 RepID=A0A9P3HAD7_9FUNG|nr:hypothetical protein EMPS_05423 [Entomortierella parvispora]